MQQSIFKAVAFIAGAQLPEGGFTSHSSPMAEPFLKERTYQTTFVPALLLGALHAVKGAGAKAICDKLAAWLLNQRSPQWSFNYWAANAAERTSLPYPDDLDDTFCAAAGLYLYKPELIGQAGLASIAKLLIATETQVGGPYRTWLVPPTSPTIWQDVDVAVNSNIAYFLRLAAGPLPKLNELMEHSITSGAFQSQYYPHEFPLFYYLSRAYVGPQQATLQKHIIDRLESSGHWGSPLRTALAISSLVELGKDDAVQLSSAVQFLLRNQQPDGSWTAESFCLDPARQGQTYYHGCAALTTALIVEALHRLDKQRTQAIPAVSTSRPPAESVHHHIIQRARHELAAPGQPLAGISLSVLRHITDHDPAHAISLLPSAFAASLPPGAHQPDQQQLLHLGLANLYGWMAYTIYDDFLDDAGKPLLLASANVAMRYSLSHFQQALPGDVRFYQTVRATFDTIDAANAWEIVHCRFAVTGGTIHIAKLPSYGQRSKLAERSLGHSLPPLAVLAARREPAAVTQATQNTFRHYLIARQLNDDLHDWEADIQAGHISYVVQLILRQLGLQPGDYPLAQLLPRMQRQFWQQTVLTVADISAGHIAAGRQALQAIPAHAGYVRQLFDQAEAPMQQTLKERAEATTFLHAYKTQ